MHAMNAMETAVVPTNSEIFAFHLGEKEYGIEIEKIQELWAYEVVNQPANAPKFFANGIQLRGFNVPVIDLRRCFDIQLPRLDQFTVVIVLNLCGRLIGMVVDSMAEILHLPAEQIQRARGNAQIETTKLLLGVGRLGKRQFNLLDIDQIIHEQQRELA